MADLKLVVWNMEWLNDLFVSDSEAVAAFHADDYKQMAHQKGVTVETRRKHLAGVLNHLAPDVVVVVEGPSRGEELQALFDHPDFDGDWRVVLQRSTYKDPEKGNTITSLQNIGIAVRVDQGKFEDEPTMMFDTADMERFPFFSYFLVDVDEDGIKEQYRFERRPLYVEVRPRQGQPFRVLGLHLKSKGIFGAYEWSKWWQLADANRRKILAQTSQLRMRFLDPYLTDPFTQGIPLIVCGDINDGPGLDESEKRLYGSGIERLMGNVWKPELCLRNALYDSLSPRDKVDLDFEKIVTARFDDPIFENTRHNAWIDHVLYSDVVSGGQRPWVSKAEWDHKFRRDGRDIRLLSAFPRASDHSPISVMLKV